MKNKRISFLLIAIFYACVSGFATSRSELQLQQVQVITRHGARTPYTVLPVGSGDNAVWLCDLSSISSPDITGAELLNAPRLYRQVYIANEETLPGNCTQGQLTENGYWMHVDLGKKFRAYYIDQLHFLSETLVNDELYIRSTDVPRTIQSAQSNLLGLYPPSFRNSQTQVIDINTLEASSETLVPNNRCPAYMQHCDDVQTTSAWAAHVQDSMPLTNYLETLWNTTSLPWWVGLWDNFEARDAQGISLPTGVTKNTVNQVIDIALWEMTALYAGPKAAQLSIGTFLGEMLQRMVDNINGNTNPKWLMYSAHDMTLALVLSAYDIFEGLGWPPYASHMLFELYKDDSSDYYVKVSFDDKDMIIPGCPDVICPFSVFQTITQNLVPVDWKKQCGLSQNHKFRRPGPVFDEFRLQDSSNPLTSYLC